MSSEVPDDGAALLPPTRPQLEDGTPIREVVELTPAEQVARMALHRAQDAARRKGLRPGDAPRRRAAPAPGTPGPGARDPQLIGSSIEGLARDFGWQPGIVSGSLQNRWAQIVGPEVADHCTFVSLDGAVLVVEASSTAWRSALRMAVPQMLARFDEELGAGVVVEVEVRGPQGPDFGRGPRRVKGRGPRDTYG